MKYFNLVIVVCACVLFNACKKQDSSQQPGAGIPTVTAKGALAGDAVSKSIGSTGGTISATDNSIVVNIPEGALAVATGITLQPISNKCPNGKGFAYRLQPEGLVFLKPVTITFVYPQDQQPDQVHIAYQDAKGYWLSMENTTVNESAKTISVSSSHFSDWSVFENYNMDISKERLAPDESTTIDITYNELLAPLVTGGPNPIQNIIPQVSAWTLNGVGSLTGKSASATYKAPHEVPGSNPQIITADIKVGNGKLILVGRVYVEDSYIDLNFKGQNYHFTETSLVLGSGTEISGHGVGTDGVRIVLNGGGTGSFNFEDPATDPLHATQLTFSFDNHTYTSFYFDCSGTWHIPPGSINVSVFGNIGAFTDGTINGTIVTATGNPACTPDLQHITGKFHIKRS